ncbi:MULTISPECIES: SCO family protein [unclassified Aureimonas]|uniref:SCO family protein n=1 Tax=unclassified Aureimonas TaxID=2615206 RepID=UPI0006FEB427|nr:MULTISPECIES: SCO family protein [unclassified Aureimonas]KQT69886.1 hypothetical protein ASG62_01925 [Aureimonas sp. Leaf427]KQT75960.1 hypothetical protein ASG54_14295 [Aureimonas sp. Leaf460]
MTRSRLAALALLLGLAAPGAALAETLAPAAEAAANLVAGHFRLTTGDGTVVDSDELVGRPYGLFFGFTNCPDICPTTLSDLTLALRSLPPAAGALRIYFVSVDPADTAETLTRYAASFDPRIVPLGGGPDAVAEAISTFGVTVQKTDLGGGRTAFGHTASVFLVDGDGLIVDRTNMQDGPEVMAGKLARLAGIPAL